ncbi:hypothetical protein FA95DRAFT_1607031 [Auriscalpium vulgare]|uniref:Uncharacterized protein n=1 Tax=Auriscalpium vulgare TaxID=40419 RepID=A0ACB8RRF0_9AGAM|nr:hypothetical protein FA95DRAFT_1607031 [Auriscalpium vulgare]
MRAVFLAAGTLAASVAVAVPAAHRGDANAVAVLSAPASTSSTHPALPYPTPTIISTPVYFTASAPPPVDRHAHAAQAVLQRAGA